MSADKKRDNYKRVLCRLSKNAQNEDMDLQEALVTLEELEKYWEKFEDAQLEVDEMGGKSEGGEMEVGQKLFFEAKIRLRITINKLTPQPEIHQPPINQQNNALPARRINTKMKIGAITLPKFSGDYRDWTSFQDLFTSLVRNDETISPAQKMYLLKAHVTGEAEALIKGFPVTDANFEIAWTLLKKRFEN